MSNLKDQEKNKQIDEINSVNSQEELPVQQQQEKEKSKSKFHWRFTDPNSPKEIYNWTLYLSVFVFGILGSARGYDEGNISGSVAQVSFKRQFGLLDPNKDADEIANLKSNITSMVQLGSVGGSLLGMYTVDKFGRVRTLQGICILWIIGAIIQITSSAVGQLYAGRLIEGLAIGQTVIVANYLSEIAPAGIRGTLHCIFAGAVYLGIMLAYFANYGTSKHMSGDSRIQWVVPTSMKIVLAGLIFILSLFFCIESPRWLVKVNKQEAAINNLSKLRHLPTDHPYVLGEICDINESIMAEKEAVNSAGGIISKFKELLLIKSVRYRFFLISAAAQVLGQWLGANAITIYAPELFSFAGIRGEEIMKMTAVLGVVKFCSAYFSAFFLIDFLGRRKALYIGIMIQLVSILYFAIFLTAVPQAAHEDAVLTTSQNHASKAAMAALYISGMGWTMGFNSVQYLLGSEIFPLGIRSFAQGLTMVLHFANQYGNSKAVPKMLIAMNNYGAFYFFVGVMLIAIFWAWFFLPEVSGRSLESMDDIFNLPWYLIGRRGAELCPDNSEVNKVSFNGNSYEGKQNYDLEKMKASQEFIERLSQASNGKQANQLLPRESEEKDQKSIKSDR